MSCSPDERMLQEENASFRTQIDLLHESQREQGERAKKIIVENARLQSELGDARAEIARLLGAISAHHEATFGHSACFERDEALWEEASRHDSKVRKWARCSLPPKQEHREACNRYRESLYPDDPS